MRKNSEDFIKKKNYHKDKLRSKYGLNGDVNHQLQSPGNKLFPVKASPKQKVTINVVYVSDYSSIMLKIDSSQN